MLQRRADARPVRRLNECQFAAQVNRRRSGDARALLCRWCNQLDPSVKKNAFDDLEDAIIAMVRAAVHCLRASTQAPMPVPCVEMAAEPPAPLPTLDLREMLW